MSPNSGHSEHINFHLEHFGRYPVLYWMKVNIHFFFECRGAKAWPCPTGTRPVPGRQPGARHLHTVQKGRYAGSAILSPWQASQSQQAACSTTPCSVWTRGPGSGARGPISEPATKKRSMIQWSSVASVSSEEATCIYDIYMWLYICGISVHVRTDLNTLIWLLFWYIILACSPVFHEKWLEKASPPICVSLSFQDSVRWSHSTNVINI